MVTLITKNIFTEKIAKDKLCTALLGAVVIPYAYGTKDISSSPARLYFLGKT
jgi:hypothetical protein